MNARVKPIPQSLSYGGYTLSVEVIGPDEAKRMLSNNGCNRRLRTAYVDAYAEDQRNGNWLPKPVAICVMPNGQLGNGQHTLEAIVKSGIPQLLLVARDVPPDIIAVMDVGAKRSINDIAHFLSLDVDQLRIGIARIIEFGFDPNASTHTFATLYDAFMLHEQAINFVLSQAKTKRRGLAAPALSVVAKAWYSADRNRLAEFLHVYATGEIIDQGDTAALRLRDVALKGSFRGYEGRVELYSKTMSALDAFLKRTPMAKIYGTSKDLFPTPHLQQFVSSRPRAKS